MARIVRRTLDEPAMFMIDGKEQWFCRCGLSMNQPYMARIVKRTATDMVMP